ncbi:MAG: ferrous iron transport protein A [Clostridia bacterium]|nr:ferrous iron transport protein A [Clostridia bacterium]
MPIVFAPENVDLKVVRILTDEKTKKHLESLGITIDSSLSLLASSGGTVVCKVKDGRVALDNDLSTKIFVVQR